ncbi:hypothetical protein HYC85_006318 [Camellia sinensis]|uniref:Uncharacterized protein n=1 Tax=Camellia sinensis TaxID=4442 RepID=A0A7J7HKM8_CAMSI|nr:hypothetical protein HYC85_006318 [Camellia sinensis]
MPRDLPKCKVALASLRRRLLGLVTPSDRSERAIAVAVGLKMTGLELWCGTKIWIQVTIVTFQVHEYLRPKLCGSYENGSISDKFGCCLCRRWTVSGNWFPRGLL